MVRKRGRELCQESVGSRACKCIEQSHSPMVAKEDGAIYMGDRGGDCGREWMKKRPKLRMKLGC